MSNFWQRAITGSVFITVIVLLVFSGSHALSLLFAAVAVAGFLEYCTILRIGKVVAPAKIRGAAVTVLVHLSFWLGFSLENNNYFLLPVFFIATSLLFDLFSEPEFGFERMMSSVFGYLWITLPFASIPVLAHITGYYEPWPVMGFFILLWVNDTGAYLAGRSMGRTKLAPSISPGKTIEGFVGGVLLAFVAAYFLSVHSGFFNLYDWMVIAAIVAVFSNAGDLVESALKRRCGVKDSGKLLPGHGGILDRFDGVLLSVPVIVAYLLFVN